MQQMADQTKSKGWIQWFQTVPGILTALAGVITAIAGLMVAITKPDTSDQQNGLPGYVWRQAVPEDQVCVTKETYLQTLQDNQLAGSRRNPAGGDYGADTCLVGYVWRDAFPGDHVCVTLQTRQKAAYDNQQASLRIKR